jgi:putative SOS response-associated peptidase YedK
MCGRYSFVASFSDVRLEFQVELLNLFRPWQPAYNITPNYNAGTEQPIVVRSPRGERELRLARWWFIPEHWSRPLKALPTTFNARVEELDEKPFYRDALRTQRCLVPATGWREFTGKPGEKQAYHFRLNEPLFAFAGLWSTYVSPDGEVIDSYTIITTEPSPAAALIHDRMPLVVAPQAYADWLDPAGDPHAVLNDARKQSLTRPIDAYASNPVGNSGRFEGPEVLERVEPRAAQVPAQQSLFAETTPPQGSTSSKPNRT